MGDAKRVEEKKKRRKGGVVLKKKGRGCLAWVLDIKPVERG